MHSPVLLTRVDRSSGSLVVTVSGPLTTYEHVEALKQLLDAVPTGYSLVIELDAMIALSAMSLRSLRVLAEAAIGQGIRLILVSESIDVRANLMLADLDSLAPVLPTLAQANHVLAAAA